jgi:peptidoglycan/LPS O-acetylase OafA/YrhL
MGAGLSTYLNFLRFGAAMIVVLSHFAYPRFSDGLWLWLRELNLGSDAVVLFFVLSGFVIALTAERKDATLRSFAFARATRIYSVAIPTLILGWGLDRWGVSLAPSEYFAPYYAPLPLWETLLRGLSFSNEWAGAITRLGSNGPYWSLSYEVGYYALFGIAFYLEGPRRIFLLIAATVLLGLNILLLIPAWLMGVWLYHRLKTGALPQGISAFCLVVIPVAIYVLAITNNIPDAFRSLFTVHGLRFSDEFVWNALIGVLVCAHLTGMAGLLRDRPLARLKLPMGWLAGASFSIYLMHYPLLQFLHAALPGIGYAALFGLTVLACFAFAEIFERPLEFWRRCIRDFGKVNSKPVPG